MLSHSQFIKHTAQQLGFSYCGIAKAGFLNEDARRLEQWLHKGFNGSMSYMENYFDLRTNPQLLVPNAKSVITVLKNYYNDDRTIDDKRETEVGQPKISKYAYGKDYHEVIKKQLNEFYDILKKQIGDFNGRGFVDSAPVLERTWAVKSGLGWVGKNGNVITKQNGSFFFIATLIVDVELDYDNAFAKDFCGTCTKCIDTCPTDAILPNKVVDGSKCISYFTIELKDALIPNNMQGKFDNWMFGCDVCQDVCPWNRFAASHSEKEFEPLPQVLNFNTKDWEELTEEQFKIIFKNSPIKRTKFAGIKRNLKFIHS